MLAGKFSVLGLMLSSTGAIGPIVFCFANGFEVCGAGAIEGLETIGAGFGFGLVSVDLRLNCASCSSISFYF